MGRQIKPEQKAVIVADALDRKLPREDILKKYNISSDRLSRYIREHIIKFGSKPKPSEEIAKENGEIILESVSDGDKNMKEKTKEDLIPKSEVEIVESDDIILDPNKDYCGLCYNRDGVSTEIKRGIDKNCPRCGLLLSWSV